MLDAGRAEELRSRISGRRKQGAHKIILDLRTAAAGRHRKELAGRTAVSFEAARLPRCVARPSRAQVSPAEPNKVAWKARSIFDGWHDSGAAEICVGAWR